MAEFEYPSLKEEALGLSSQPAQKGARERDLANTCEQSDSKKWGQTVGKSKEIHMGRSGTSALEKSSLSKWGSP